MSILFLKFLVTFTKRFEKHFKDLFECSVNMDIRIIWYYEDDKLIILVDVGHHDILDQY